MPTGGLKGGAEDGRRAVVDFLTCPPEPMLEDFAGRPGELDAALIKSVSRHLGRCAACRGAIERWRRSNETPGSRRLWIWAVAAALAMFLAALLFV
ncbi:MAG TPA: hypothetical protein VFG76_13250, partial [Candidatus Polarisedimenticolia bacterium]|nr:hypothetical protein [Candidatus Polarisedimenticolia bacterium]